MEETIRWLDDNAMGTKETYEEKMKEVEAVIQPIMAKMYSATAGPGGQMPMGGMPGGMPTGSGPQIDEVD